VIAGLVIESLRKPRVHDASVSGAEGEAQ
jgi:hypothetical protein